MHLDARELASSFEVWLFDFDFSRFRRFGMMGAHVGGLGEDLVVMNGLRRLVE